MMKTKKTTKLGSMLECSMSDKTTVSEIDFLKALHED